MKRPEHQGDYENLFSNTAYYNEANFFIDQLEKERDGLKEEIKNHMMAHLDDGLNYHKLEGELQDLKDKIDYLPESLPEHQSSLGWIVKKADLKKHLKNLIKWHRNNR